MIYVPYITVKWSFHEHKKTDYNKKTIRLAG